MATQLRVRPLRYVPGERCKGTVFSIRGVERLRDVPRRSFGNPFGERFDSPAWQEKLQRIIPSLGTRLNDDPERLEQQWAYTGELLQLTPAAGISDETQPVEPQEIDPANETHEDLDPELAP